MRKNVLILALVTLFSWSGLWAQTINPEHIDGQIYIGLEGNGLYKIPSQKKQNVRDFEFLSSIAAEYGITKVERPFFDSYGHKISRVLRVYFTEYAKVNQLVQAVQKSSIVEYAEPQALRKKFAAPNDPYYSTGYNWQWYLPLINAEAAWDIHQGNATTKVAVVDGAVYAEHEDLASKIVAQYDATDGSSSSSPPSYGDAYEWSHGTHCAGLVGAITNNNTGIAGIGRGLSIIGVKGGADSNGDLTGVDDGVQWAANNDADVISMSFGGTYNSQTEENLMDYCRNTMGCVLIVAAGNDNNSTPHYPAAFSSTIAVGSVDSDDSRSSFSCYGSWVDIAGPGGNDVSTNVGCLSTTYCTSDYDASAYGAPAIDGYGVSGRYHMMSGTSMACPVVAGVAGLLRSYNPDLTPDEIESCLLSSAASISTDQNIGPRVDAAAALQCIESTLTGVFAEFTGTPTTIYAGESVTYTDQSSTTTGSISSWSWSFPGGDNTSYSGQTPPAITYNTPGYYDVSLTAGNGTDSDTETKADYIYVRPQPTCEDLSSADYTMGFEDGEDWSEWLVEDENNDGYTFDTAKVGTNFAHSGENVAAYFYNQNGTTAASDYYFTKCLSLEAGVEYNLSFWYRVGDYQGTTYPEKLKVMIGSAQESSAMTQQIVDLGTLNNITFTESSNTFTVSSSGNYYIGFHCYSDADMFYLLVDDINISQETVLAPEADFQANATTIAPGDNITLTDLSTNNPDAWSWSITPTTGVSYINTTSNSSQNPQVQFDNAGTYTVALTASNDGGSDTETKTDYIEVTVSGTAPTAEFSGTPLSIFEGQTVVFTDESTDSPTSWTWTIAPTTGVNYVNSTTNQSQNPEVQFDIAGTYDVTLTASNSFGSNEITKNAYIIVNAAPECDTLSNIADDENLTLYSFNDPQWGPVTGHNSYDVPSYAEKFTFAGGNNNELSGLYLYVYHAENQSGSASIDLKIYANGTTPGAELYSQTIPYSDFTASNWNYIELSTPQIITDDFYIGYDINYGTPLDTFSVVHSATRGVGGLNTVYLKFNGNWQAYPDLTQGETTISMAMVPVICSPQLDVPTPEFTANNTEICEGDVVVITDETTNDPTDWTWEVTPSTGVSFVNGTSNTDQNPEIEFANAGIYSIKLTAENANGSEFILKEDYITVSAAPTAQVTADQTICEGESVTLTAEGGDEYLWSTDAQTAEITVEPTQTTAYIVTVSNACGTDVADISVTVNPLPVAEAGDPQTICEGESATLTATGGDDYLWSTDAQTAQITVSPTETTVYTVTATNSCGDAIDEVEVTVNPLPVAVVIEDQTICEGESVTLTAEGGDEYLWNTDAQTAEITVSPTETTAYIVTVTNSCGTDVADISVTVNPIPVADVTADQTICEGESVTLEATGGDEYMWNTDAETAEITVSPTETTAYIVTVSNSCGNDVADINVTVNPLPDANAGLDEVICNGDDVVLTATGGDEFIWSTDEQTAEITVAPTVDTEYYVTVSTSCGSEVDTVNVIVTDVATAYAGEDVEICLGETTDLTATGGNTYTWSTDDETAQINVMPTETTTYTVTVTSSCGTATDEVMVTVHDLPVASAGDNAEVCQGESVDLTATGGESYVWSTDEETAQISVAPTETTTYTVEVINEFGCSAEAQVEVVVNMPVDVSLVIAADNETICTDDEVIFVATPGNGGTTPSYEWFVNDVTAGADNDTLILSDLEDGDIVTCEVTTDLSCVTNTTAVSNEISITVNTLPTVGFSYTVDQGVVDFTNESVDATSYEWDFDDGATSSEENPSHTYTADGTYIVTLTATNDCGDVVTEQEVTVVGLGVERATNLPLVIYPNPASDYLVIENLKAGIIELYDEIGRKIYVNKVDNSSMRIDVSNLASGMYIVKVVTNSGFETYRISKR